MGRPRRSKRSGHGIYSFDRRTRDTPLAEAGAGAADGAGSRSRPGAEQVLDRLLIDGLGTRADEGDRGLIAPLGVGTGERDVPGPAVAIGRGREWCVGSYPLRGQLILDEGFRREMNHIDPVEPEAGER